MNLKIVDLSKVDGASCEKAMGFATTNENYQGLLKVIARYKNAINNLNPKVKSDLKNLKERNWLDFVPIVSSFRGLDRRNQRRSVEKTYKNLTQGLEASQPLPLL